MTTSGYLSSSREGKLPETKLRKMSADPELDTLAEKKVNMKKVLEGIKKSDERNSDFGKKPNEIPKDREVGLCEEKRLTREIIKEGEDCKKERSKEKSERGTDRENERDNEFESVSERPYEVIKQHDKEKEKDQEKEMEVEKAKEREKEQDKVKFCEKEKEKEKEKLKKKRGKEKLLEEFAFFEKEKVVSLKTSEPVSSVDSTKQKLNIFKKRTGKTRDQDNQSIDRQTPRISLHSRIATESTDMLDKSVIETFSSGPSKSQTEGASPSKIELTTSYEKPKIAKKDRKLKSKRDRYEYSSEAMEAVGDHHKRKPGKDFLKADPTFFKSESLESIESTSFGKVNLNKINNPLTNDNSEPPKKKRGRPRATTPEQSEPSSELVASTHVESSLVPSIPKPFIPFTSHFPVPGLIPPPFIPLNLLGIPPMGLRSPLVIPPSTSTGPNATNMSSLSPVTHHKGDSLNRIQSMTSPTSKSPNIVDSLTESADMSMDAVLSCGEEDSSVNKKKEKREKKDKEKRKKDKKLKGKVSDDLDKKAKREKKKEKKDKEKEKDKPDKKEKEENITVPKITFKFAAAPTSPPPPSAALEITPKM